MKDQVKIGFHTTLLIVGLFLIFSLQSKKFVGGFDFQNAPNLDNIEIVESHNFVDLQIFNEEDVEDLEENFLSPCFLVFDKKNDIGTKIQRACNFIEFRQKNINIFHNDLPPPTFS